MTDQPTRATDPRLGVLVLAGTPLGNLGDATPRLRQALGDADVVAAEDTRRLRRLARDLGVEVSGRIVSNYDAVETDRVPELLGELTAGSTVLLVTDAGMPSVSDPGYRLVDAALDAGVRVTCLPGPSAVPVALALSGLPSDRFCFEGFLPRKAGERARTLAALADERRTMVFFEAPHRLTASLEALRDAFGADRRAAVCRELTKTYEEVRRAPLADLVDWAAAGDVRGEITLVVAGADVRRETPPPDELRALVDAEVAAGSSRKDAVALVAERTGVPRRVVYAAGHG